MVSTFSNLILSNGAAAASLGVIAVLVLVVLIIQKELASAGQGSRHKRLRSVLNIGILPLMVILLIIVFLKIAKSFP